MTPVPDDCRYRAFISYSHADQAWADWLHKALETYRVPSRLVGSETAAGVIPRRLTPIFRDRDELASAADLGAKVNTALAQSANLIVICSPRAAASRWVNEEVLAFKRLGRSERVFCLIVDGEPNASDIPGREAEECFVPALRFAADADGALSQRPAEPIAADVRAGKDGKTNAKLKLIAGMLDVGFDALKQREQQRRLRRMTAITALAVIVMTVTTTLAITAVIARGAADTARQAAERRQQQSEDLINYMLGDLNDKLNEVGRLDIMEGVADKAMAYFAALPSSDVSDTTLAQRATALQRIGSVRMDQGQTPAALAAYRAAARIQAELMRRTPADIEREIAYADSLTSVGSAYWYQGDLERAGQNFRTSSDMLQTAATARPNDSELVFKLAAAQSNYGHVLEAGGNFARASTQYQAALQVYEMLRVRHPQEARWQSELGYIYNSLGKLALERGDMEEAIARYHDDHKIKAALASRQPNNQQWRSDLAVSDAILAGALALAGETASAATHASAAVDSGQALVSLDPENGTRQDYLALYRIRLASLLRQQGKLDKAAGQATTALHILSALIAKQPASADLLPDLAKVQVESARVALASGRPAEARRLASAALGTVKPLLIKRVDDRTSALIATRADCLLGDLAASERDSAESQAHWRKARDRIAPLARAGGNPELLDAWAGTLLRLGERKAAAPLVARLQRMGYRDADFVALLQREGVEYPANVAFQQRIAALLP